MKKGPKPDPQSGERLFNALRELEIQFLNGGHSVQTSVQQLLKDHKVPYVHEMAKYLIEQSIVKRDAENSTHKKPYYWYNGPRLNVKYCNDLFLQMKLDRSASENPKLPPGYIDHNDPSRSERPNNATPDRFEKALTKAKKRQYELTKELEIINQVIKYLEDEV